MFWEFGGIVWDLGGKLCFMFVWNLVGVIFCGVGWVLVKCCCWILFGV